MKLHVHLDIPYQTYVKGSIVEFDVKTKKP